MAALVLAAAPLIVFASTNIGLQSTGVDDHAAAGHYGFVTAFSFTIIGMGLLASLRPDGWRLTAWVAGVPLLVGLASLIYPVSSSLSPPWALAPIAWGFGFVVVAERSGATEGALVRDGGERRQTPSDQLPS
ncbi:MAG TPA: hypothetical protein VFY46_04655 [Acidimicrobiia bacterium]|nr:hypothetical protein [Acidimicrobiia bacterium]